MGIRAVVIISCLPVFLGLGLLSAWIEHYAVQHELVAAVEEESRAVAIGIAAFLDRVEAGEPSSSARAWDLEGRLPELSLLRRFTTLRHATLRSVPDQRVLWEAEIGSETNELRSSGPGAGQSEPFAFTALFDSLSPALEAARLASAEVRGPAGVPVAAVTVELDSSDVPVRMAALHETLVLRVAVVTGLAIPLGWIFGTFLTRRLRAAHFRTCRILEEPLPQEAPRTGVKELDDVNDAIEILAALFEERAHGMVKLESPHGNKKHRRVEERPEEKYLPEAEL